MRRNPFAMAFLGNGGRFDKREGRGCMLRLLEHL